MLYGARLLPPRRRQQQLQASLAAMFDEYFASRVLPFDSAAANAYARIAADRKQVGQPISQFDAQIAAVELANDSDLAGDFKGCGVSVITLGGYSGRAWPVQRGEPRGEPGQFCAFGRYRRAPATTRSRARTAYFLIATPNNNQN